MRPSTLSIFALIVSQINNALCFSPSPGLVTKRSLFGHHQHNNKNKIRPLERRRSQQLFLLEDCLDAVSGSFLVAGSELLDATLFAMDDSMMTPEYAALDSDPAVSMALGIIFVTLLTLISIVPAEGEETKTGTNTDKEDLVMAQASKVEGITTRDIVAEEQQVAKPKSPGRTENLPNDLHNKHGIPLEVGALLMAYKDRDDGLFQRALALLVETIRLTTAELNETKRLLRDAQEEKRSLEDQYDLRLYQLVKAEEKLKELRSMDRQ